jgi:hypothetical protein
MNAVARKDTLTALDGINLTELQRARVKHAAQQSDVIVTAVLAMAQYLGIARPAGHKS